MSRNTSRARGALLFAACIACLSGFEAAAWAQGMQTRMLTGTVTTSDGMPVPDVRVTVRSPTLQGARRTRTNGQGVYALRGLPGGPYVATFERESLEPVERQVAIGA